MLSFSQRMSFGVSTSALVWSLTWWRGIDPYWKIGILVCPIDFSLRWTWQYFIDESDYGSWRYTTQSPDIFGRTHWFTLRGLSLLFFELARSFPAFTFPEPHYSEKSWGGNSSKYWLPDQFKIYENAPSASTEQTSPSFFWVMKRLSPTWNSSILFVGLSWVEDLIAIYRGLLENYSLENVKLTFDLSLSTGEVWDKY